MDTFMTIQPEQKLSVIQIVFHVPTVVLAHVSHVLSSEEMPLRWLEVGTANVGKTVLTLERVNVVLTHMKQLRHTLKFWHPQLTALCMQEQLLQLSVGTSSQPFHSWFISKAIQSYTLWIRASYFKLISIWKKPLTKISISISIAKYQKETVLQRRIILDCWWLCRTIWVCLEREINFNCTYSTGHFIQLLQLQACGEWFCFWT